MSEATILDGIKAVRPTGEQAAMPGAAIAEAQPEAPEVVQRRVLHVGCGHPNPRKLHVTFREPGWTEVRLDIDPKVKPDIVGTMTQMDEVADSSVDAVWSSHNIEHLYAN